MQLGDMEITSFVSREQQRQRSAVMRYARVDRQRRRPKTYAGSMLIKIGFCLAVLGAAILVQKFVLTEEQKAVVEASAEESEHTQDESSDVLGRLRFVEAGGVRSVFATKQRWNLPVKSNAAQLTQDDTLLQIDSKAGETVSVSAAGEVLAIARDDALGAYIRVFHGSDLESVYYNVDDIRVEVGQPLLASDTLGRVGDGGMLYVKITQSGAPQEPAAYLDIPD